MSKPVEDKSRNVACPSCGAPVRFRGATSIVSVCPFCKSTLVRKGVDIESVGKQAELLEDQSPIRIGADGKHRGIGFTVVGRIQFKYEGGIWNEWHVLFADGKSAWLSDASREYTISYAIPPQVVKPFEALKPGATIHITGGKWFSGEYSVTNLDTGEVVAGEGELPFQFTSGWKANVADLRGEGARFATIDYSDVPPLIYVGEKLPFDTFAFSGLRDPGQGGGFTTGTALAFKCAGCGAPIEKHVTTTEVVACGSCGTVSDVSGPVAQLVQKNEKNVAGFSPLIPLGTIGRWKNAQYEVVGFMRRGVNVDGVLYQWSEYLLHNIEQGYAWITEYNGHYNWVRTAAELPRDEQAMGQPKVKYLGRSFKHFQKSQAKVTYLTGEFYWRVQLGEVADCNDYVEPPLILSSEGTGKEISWSVGEYVEPGVIFKAFGLKSKPRAPVGVAPNQPSPYKGKVGPYWLAFIAFVGLGLVAQLFFAFMQSSTKAPALPFEAATGEPARVTSAPFKLGGFGSTPLTVRTATNASREWVSVDLQLTNADTGRAYSTKRSLGYHNISGSLQGSSIDVGEIPGVPSGRYTLAVEARSPVPVRGTVEVYRSRVGWSNFWLFAGFLGLWPVIALLRAWAFEKKRWLESDYAPEESSDDPDLDSDDD